MKQLLRVVQRVGEGNLLRVEEYLAREKTAGSLSARKNDRANTGRAVTRRRRWTGLQKGSMEAVVKGKRAPEREETNA
jgi:hypothetical protein